MLMLPRSGSAAVYQVAVYFPGSDAVRARPRAAARSPSWLAVPGGAAAVRVAFPIYQQTYERRRQPTGANFLREVSIQRGQDVRRTIDYLRRGPTSTRRGSRSSA